MIFMNSLYCHVINVCLHVPLNQTTKQLVDYPLIYCPYIFEFKKYDFIVESTLVNLKGGIGLVILSYTDLVVSKGGI